jgi:hypothetical protein
MYTGALKNNWCTGYKDASITDWYIINIDVSNPDWINGYKAPPYTTGVMAT